MGEVAEEVRQLMEVTKEALRKGTAQAKAGNRVGDISAAVQEYAEVSATALSGSWRDTVWGVRCTRPRVFRTTAHAAEDRFSNREWSSVLNHDQHGHQGGGFRTGRLDGYDPATASRRLTSSTRWRWARTDRTF